MPKIESEFTSEKDVKIIKKIIAYNGRFQIIKFQLQFRLFDGGWSKMVEREVFSRGHAVGVLLYDPALDSVVLIEQFRLGALEEKNPWLLEIIGGMIEHDMPAEEVARKETKEEAGVEVKKLIPMYHYYSSPGGSTESMQLFCGVVDLSKAGGVFGLLHEEVENIRAHVVKCEEAYQLLQEGHIINAPAIIALQWLQLNRRSLKNLS